MRRLLTLTLVMFGASAAPPLEAAESTAAQAAAPKPVLVALDFRSTFDKGETGAKVAEIISGHAARTEKFQTYDVLSRDEVLTHLGFRAEPETPAEEVARAGREGFGATYVFWGEVQPAKAGYTVHFKAVDCRDELAKLVIDEERSAENVHVIPLLVDEVLRQLTGEPAPVTVPDPAAERAWQTNPNLLPNGSFEKGSDHPAGWDPLPDYAHWVASPDGGGRCLQFDLDKGRAESYGGLYQSDYIPLRPGATYRFQVRVKSLGPTPKVFLKGYDEFPATFGFQAQPREVYRRDINGAPTGDWVTYSGDFAPHHATSTPRSLRVMLYAYLKPGAIYFDDCVLKEIKPPQGKGSKETAGDASTAPH
jgi:hypothetical protein